MNPSIHQSIWPISDQDTKTLVSIARIHTKLALEHGRINTLPQRRKEIVDEIRRLKQQRDLIINKYL
jgi:cell division protein FtsB